MVCSQYRHELDAFLRTRNMNFLSKLQYHCLHNNPHKILRHWYLLGPLILAQSAYYWDSCHLAQMYQSEVFCVRGKDHVCSVRGDSFHEYNNYYYWEINRIHLPLNIITASLCSNKAVTTVHSNKQGIFSTITIIIIICISKTKCKPSSIQISLVLFTRARL